MSKSEERTDDATTENSNVKSTEFTQLEAESSQQQQQLSDADLEAVATECGAVLSCVTLLRNALHMQPDMVSGGSSPISEEDSSSATSSSSKPSGRQNQILWNFFSANLDATVINMIANPCLSQWCMQVMQLIALIYKDQHVSDLQQMLAVWLATEISDSSEDNESNTSPQDQNGSCSSPILTSNETDDSENGNGNGGNGGNGSKNNSGGGEENVSCIEADESSSSSSETPVGPKFKKQRKTKVGNSIRLHTRPGGTMTSSSY